jgi:hypothetical protein
MTLAAKMLEVAAKLHRLADQIEADWVESVPTAHVTATVTVDGEALPPFYTRKTQQEIGGQFTSRTHTGE